MNKDRTDMDKKVHERTLTDIGNVIYCTFFSNSVATV